MKTVTDPHLWINLVKLYSLSILSIFHNLVNTSSEYIDRLKKRLLVHDAEAYFTLGTWYKDGGMGLPKNRKKALELLNKGSKLGSPRAHYQLAQAYFTGEGVERDLKKENHYLELAAMSGHEVARHNLGGVEVDNGNMNRAMKHFMLSAKAGFDASLKAVADGYKDGHVTKDDYATTLRVYQSSCKEMKSEQRTKAEIKGGWK